MARRNPRTKYCGVYAIYHKDSGRLYIGGSTDITGRYTYHRFMLRRGMHKSKPLQEAWLRYGEAAFKFMTLELCSKEQLLALEQEWLDDHMDRLLNGCRFAITGKAGVPSEAKRQAAVRRWQTPGHREKVRASLAATNARKQQDRPVPSRRENSSLDR